MKSDTSDRLIALAIFYFREAERCSNSRAYLASCILMGAALEALLLSMCFLEGASVRRTRVYRQRNFKMKRN
jgi:hypothetical protein